MIEIEDPAAGQVRGAPPETTPSGVQRDTFAVGLHPSTSPSEVFRAFADSYA